MTDDLLVKFLLGEASPEEKEQVNRWLEASAGNRAYLDGLQRIWQQSRELALVSEVDADAAWSRFKSRVAVNNNKEEAPVKKANLSFLRVAAAIVLLVGLVSVGWWWINSPGPVKELAFVSSGEVRNDVLPDGSTVSLNKNSELQYPSRFESGKRKVKLKGEAFFDVERDTGKPFEIETGPVKITVLGTSFNVKNKGNEIEVLVESGSVQVEYGDKKIILGAGEKTVINSGEPELEKEEQTDQLHNYYRSRVFVCDNTPLWRLVEVLNEAYDVEIVFGRASLRDLSWDTTINNESLDAILNLLTETFDIKVKKQGNKIILQ